jgi:uncharacterized LabA/DUF88 family protein
LADTRLKIAVFIDFDNIEIGVKSTLNTQFDIGVVLEALRERGDVVSKIAYGDWTRAGDYSRSLTQHATKLLQRNLTPGGDKNGADINLALDALEMAFTHPHINAYVIVGGDSDFITLVEKLKQYDKQIFVVGGRAFTSVVMQRNCHEFIAYENLLGSRRGPSDRGRQTGAAAQMPIEQVVPLVRRALKILSDREVSPQLGLLKSTLLQLDSTFSERTYGAGSFRDFAQKLAAAGHVTVKEAGRNVLVELAEGPPVSGEDQGRSAPHRQAAPRHGEGGTDQHRRARDDRGPQEERSVAGQPFRSDSEQPPEAAASGEAPRAADGVREVRRLFQAAPNPPRWPMYIRQAKQFMRNVDPTFDERKFGFASLVDLLRACGREGLFRMERDRQGVIRLFPGNVMQPAVGDDVRVETAGAAPAVASPRPWRPGDDVPEAREDNEVVEGAVVQELETPAVLDAEPAQAVAAEAEPSEPQKGRGRTRKQAAGPRTTRESKQPRARKTASTAKPRASRAKKSAVEG